jgi:hypothetical protein
MSDEVGWGDSSHGTRISHALEAALERCSEQYPALTALRALSWISLAYAQPVWVTVDWPEARRPPLSSLTLNDQRWYGLATPHGEKPIDSCEMEGLRISVFSRPGKAEATGPAPILCNAVERLPRYSREALAKVFNGCEAGFADAETLPAVAPDREVEARAIDHIRRRLGRVNEEWAHVAQFSPRRTEPGGAGGGPGVRSVANLFTILRRPLDRPRIVHPPATGAAPRQRQPNRFGYTARYLLTPEQYAGIDEFFGAQGVAARMEAELSPLARSLSDSVFESGCVDLSRASERERGAANPFSRSFRAQVHDQDRERDDREAELFAALQTRQKVRDNLLYWPVHVDGTPWVCQFTLVPEDQEGRLYYIYRDLVPSLAEAIRQAAVESYYDMLTEVVQRLLLGGGADDDRFGAVNRVCDQLCLFWPFPRLQFAPRRAGEADASDLPFLCAASDNPWWRPRIAWPPQVVPAERDARLNALHANYELVSLRSSTDSYYHVAHILSNLLPTIRADDMLREYTVRDDKGNHTPTFEIWAGGQRESKSEEAFNRFLVKSRLVLDASKLMIQLMRIPFDGWVLPADKWRQARGPYQLRDILEDARADASLATMTELKVEHVGGADFAVSGRYLREEFVRCVLFELLRNVAKHACPAEGGLRRCSVTVARCEDDPAEFHVSIRNLLRPELRALYAQDDDGLWAATTNKDVSTVRRKTFLKTLIRLGKQGAAAGRRQPAPFEIAVPEPDTHYTVRVRFREARFVTEVGGEIAAKPIKV